jgi:hypothetical protein
MENLPDEILTDCIFTYFNIKELILLRAVCKKFKNLAFHTNLHNNNNTVQFTNEKYMIKFFDKPKKKYLWNKYPLLNFNFTYTLDIEYNSMYYGNSYSIDYKSSLDRVLFTKFNTLTNDILEKTKNLHICFIINYSIFNKLLKYLKGNYINTFLKCDKIKIIVYNTFTLPLLEKNEYEKLVKIINDMRDKLHNNIYYKIKINFIDIITINRISYDEYLSYDCDELCTNEEYIWNRFKNDSQIIINIILPQSNKDYNDDSLKIIDLLKKYENITFSYT